MNERMKQLLELLQLAPVVAQLLPVDERIAAAISEVLELTNREIEHRASVGNMTREELIASARQNFADAARAADDLLRLGHEGERQ